MPDTSFKNQPDSSYNRQSAGKSEKSSDSETYRGIVDCLQQGIFLFSAVWKLAVMNHSARVLLDSSGESDSNPEFSAGTDLSDLFPEAVFPGWKKRLQLMAKSKMVETLTARAGEAARVFTAAVISLKENGNVAGFVVVLDEVTGLREKTRRLSDLQKEAEKGVFASSVAHELNNYLATILGGSELAELALQKGKTDRAVTALEKLKTNIHKTEEFSDRLAAFARMETHKSMHDVNETITDVVSFIAGSPVLSGIEICLELDETLQSFSFDVDQMAQLLLNAMENAAEAIRASEKRDGRIVICTESKEANILISVTDNGKGITEDVRKVLFVSRYSSKGSGHGFGLRRCAKVVENHSGSYSIQSTVGDGSTFTFSFPLQL